MNTYTDLNIPNNVNKIIEAIISSFKAILLDNLIGIYLHGSLAMNCFNPKTSDIDFLVIIKDELSFKMKKEIIEATLAIYNSYILPEKGLEYSILLQKDLINFTHPTPFELHFSNSWKEYYEKGEIDSVKTDKDRDLAAHLTITLNRGVCLFGKPIVEVFFPIPETDYIDSIIFDIEEIEFTIRNDPVYAILNLCRVLYFLKEGRISSKKEAGVWALDNIPIIHKEIVQNALSNYEDFSNMKKWKKSELSQFTDYMLSQIHEMRKLKEMMI